MRILTIGILLLLTVITVTAVQNGNDLYQQGLARETAGDIKGAIQIFERIVRDYSSNRPLTARALVQLGRWSDLLGEDQARKHYERVVREFSDQKDAATEARARLGVLDKFESPNAGLSRRLVIADWPDWMAKTGNTSRRVMRDGRHLLRYNGEQRAFEEIEISTGSVRRLTSEGPNPAEMDLAEGDQSMELSANGRRIAAAFRVVKPEPVRTQALEYERIELRVFDVGGRGMGRVLASWATSPENQLNVDPFAWSPRDDRIWLTVTPSDQSVQIASVDMSGKVEVLKTLPWVGNTQRPHLSPDGRFLAYHNATGRQTPPDIYIIATDGSREHRIEHPAHDSRPVFTPDGSGIVFVSNRRGFRDLWYQALADGRPFGQPRLVWHNVGHFGYAHRFTETGSLYYYFAVNDWGTYTAPLDLGAGSIGEVTRLDPVLNEVNSGAAFSPDGRYLAHFRANASRIVVRDLATGREREMPLGASLQASYSRLDWCTNGDTLIAGGYVNGTGHVTYRASLKDASVQRLPISAISWPSPVCIGDGEEIIYVPATPVAAAAGTMIVQRSLATGRERTLFEGSPVAALARSFDGKRLAIVTFDPNSDVARLVTMPAAGGDVSAPLMTSGTIVQGSQKYALMDVTWMPGDRLFVVRADDASRNPNGTPRGSFWEVPLNGDSPRKLGDVPPTKTRGRPASNFAIHPDGKSVAFQFHEGFVAQTWAIDNLAQFIKAGGGW